MITTEVFVSIDGNNFNILDLSKNESINMKFSKKELQDITKVFSPYSMNFNFPSTPRNKLALGFFGNTEVLKVNATNEFDCKIYTNGMLSQIGKLKLKSVKYKSNKAEEFTASFTTTFLSLKERLGDETINNLGIDEALVSFKSNNVYNRLQSVANITVDGLDVKYFIPLISNRRVWQYSNNVTLVDNIKFVSTNNPKSDKVVNIGELRPAINVISIINLIKKKYNLIIQTPIEQTSDLTQLFMWCNGSNFTRPNANKFIFTQPFLTGLSFLGAATVNLTDSSVKITLGTSSPIVVRYRITLINHVIGDQADKASATVSIVRKSDLVTILTFDFEINNVINGVDIFIPRFYFTASQLEFFTFIKFDRPVFWRHSEGTIQVENIPIANFSNNFNSDLVGSDQIDLLKSLPEMKVIDFLTSYLKTFNLSIYDSSPTNDNLFFLTPKDINTSSLIYSKREVNYTSYTDISSVEKEVNNPYNYYNFKHVDSKYKSNVDFEKQFKIKYGQTFFPLVKPDKTNEFKVETAFSIIPPVNIIGMQNTITFYGFSNEPPEVNDFEQFRYTPNLNEPTLFYSHGAENLENSLGVQNLTTAQTLVTSALNSYIKVLPYCKQTTNTLGFSILTINGVNYSNSLFLNYYSQFIQRILNTNALSQTFNLILPSSEIYLNEDSTVQGLGQTPNGFRLQNEIIIGETKFEILEATIDITTGRAKLILLNF